MLGLGMDEADEDEDEQMLIKDIPFVAERDFLEKYGTSFNLGLDENRQVVLSVAESCA